MVKRHLSLVLVAILGFICGCSSSDRPRNGRQVLEFPHKFNKKNNVAHEQEKKMVRFFPWENWPLFYDLKQQKLNNLGIITADEELKAGNRTKALELYLKAQSSTLSISEKEALALRIASTELALDQSARTLLSISSFFREQKKTVNDVDVRFSLIMAYAYGRKSDYDQSLAWFSRVNRISTLAGPVSASADQGLRELMRSMDEGKLDSLLPTWQTDTFVHRIIGEERARRVAAGTPQGDSQYFANIWRPEYHDSVIGPEQDKLLVGILLPITGKFAALGNNTRKGIALAFEAQGPEIGMTYSVQDTQGEATIASAKARELIQKQHAAVILGPLLAEPAKAVAELSHQLGFPLLTLSKQSLFDTGSGVFRFGTTTSSQINTLLEGSSQSLGISRFALVYPESASGIEFATKFKEQLYADNPQGAITFEATYNEGDENAFIPIAEELEKVDSQGIFMPDTLHLAGRLFANLSEDTRSQLRPLGTALWDNLSELRNSSTVLNGAVFVSPFFTESTRPIVQNFVQAYQAKYGSKPDFLAAQGFDAATMLISALRRSMEEEIDFSVAFKGIEAYDGITGRIEVSPDGEVLRRYTLVQMKDGRITDLMEEQIQENVVSFNNQYEEQEGN